VVDLLILDWGEHSDGGGAPAAVKREITGTPAGDAAKGNGPFYAELARRHKKGATEV
jgi:hypothetical protein